MKIQTIIFATLILLTSCSTSRVKRSERELARAIEAQQRMATVQAIVESGSFTIMFDQTHSQTGYVTQLNREFNFITVDKANIEMILAYTGRQYGVRPVAAINLQGRASVYNIERDMTDGGYLISFQVAQGQTIFTVSMTISGNSSARALVLNDRIEPVEYKGVLYIP